MAKSLISKEKKCFITGATQGLHKHHIFFGNPQRKYSEEDGLWVWLRFDWHNGQTYSVHQDHKLDLMLKMIAQKKYEENHSREEFIKRYIRSYL